MSPSSLNPGCAWITGLFFLALSTQSAGVSDNDWKFSVDDRITSRLVFTDNRRLNSDKESDTVLDIRPGISLVREGARAKLDMDYDLGISQSLSGDQGARLTNILKATFNSELYENTWFLDATAGADLVGASGLSTLGSDGIYDDNNSKQAYSFSVSPYSRHHLGKYLDILTRTTFDLVGAEDSAISDSGGADFLLTLQSGRYFTRFPWSISFRESVVDRESRTDERRSVIGQVSFRHSRQWIFFGSLGVESNDVDTTRDDTEGMTWSVGTGWTPNPRTNVALNYGERYFGSNWNIQLSHQSRRTNLAASYSRSVANARSVVQEALTGTLLVNGQPVIDSITGDPVSLQVLVPQLLDEDFVQDAIQVAATLTGKRTTLSVQTNWSNRTYEISRREEDVYGVTSVLSRRISPRTNGSARISWQQTEADIGSARSTSLIGLSITKNLGRHSSAVLEISHRQQDEGNGNDFDENRLSAGFTTQIW